ncbi:MAG: TlpA disulfide reductase family protein [Myxococcota bacterium]
MTQRQAPPLQVDTWLNTDEAITLDRLRGRVVVIHAFQMLCPGCVLKGIPQAKRVAEVFRDAPVDVIGLHTVFEHHDAMQLPSLRAFLHEFDVRFAVGVDRPGDGADPIPQTMRAYEMRGTPTTILIDKAGRIASKVFGVHDDLALGSAIERLVLDPSANVSETATRTRDDEVAVAQPSASANCSDEHCEVS